MADGINYRDLDIPLRELAGSGATDFLTQSAVKKVIAIRQLHESRTAALHEDGTLGKRICSECFMDWPCATIAIVEGHFNGAT